MVREREVEEVEVERLPHPDELGGKRPRRWSSPRLRRLVDVLAPVWIGLLIDALDLVVRHPVAGLAAGAPLGFWAGRRLGLDAGGVALATVAVALYCALPVTNLLPLATLFGLWCVFRYRSRPLR